MIPIFIKNFTSIRPPYETTQREGLEWLVAAHTQAESQLCPASTGLEEFQEGIQTALKRVGCKPEHIQKRGHILPDFLHRDWTSMRLYRLSEQATGENLSVRQKIFEEWADTIFEELYSDAEEPPEELIHATCTGYVAPSSAQKRVSALGWGRRTTVTHAYHMGCYASIPALRIASGYLATAAQKKRVDIVHTEGCTLHLNPTLHAMDQLVSQSLFSDGAIRYSLTREEESGSLRLCGDHNELLPDSTEAMTWNPSPWGFLMSLSKEIPIHILRHIQEALSYLNCPDWQDALFAIHPGGPKILSYIQKALGLKDWQIAHSRQILYEYGNMSSATLPHIWQSISMDDSVQKGTRIVSFAFGPGLSLWSCWMEKY